MKEYNYILPIAGIPRKNNGTLYVPKGSTGYDVWMRKNLNQENWTLIEQ